MKTFKLLSATLLALTLSFSMISVGNVDASTVKKTQKVVTYKTCTDLNKVYKAGVSNKQNAKNKVVNQKTKKAEYKTSKATFNTAVYKANIKLDKDNDGIACEK